MRVAVIVNEGGGAAAASKEPIDARLRRAFAEAQVDADIKLVPPAGLEEALEEASRSSADAIVAGGGDGTISLAAGVAVRSRRVLGVLPLGTLNHLARDAGIPADVEGAVKVIAQGAARPIDVAEVNGRIFVNNSSVGLYPMIVREREAQQHRLRRSKRVAMLIASVRAVRHFRRHRLTIKAEGNAAPIQTPLLFIGNNRYETGLFSLGQRTVLDGGELCLYAPLARTRWQLVALSLRALFGRLDEIEDFVSLTGVDYAEVESETKMLNVSADGEALRLASPLTYRILPGALQLLMPPPRPTEPAAER